MADEVLLTVAQIEQRLRAEVYRAGGAKKWNRKHKVNMDHALHMLDNGSAATLDRVLEALGFERVTLYRERAPTGQQTRAKQVE